MNHFLRLQRPSVFTLPLEGADLMNTATKPPQNEALADYVRRIRQEKNLSVMDVERESARHGPKIAGSYVNRIENGVARKPSADRLIALAHGLGIQQEELFAVVRGKSLVEPSGIEERFLIRFRELPPARQEDVLKIVDVLHREHAVKPTKIKPKKTGSRAA
jgi:transcriptional regulator with XRE-family HTH domain